MKYILAEKDEDADVHAVIIFGKPRFSIFVVELISIRLLNVVTFS